jgi:Methyltransferase domain
MGGVGWFPVKPLAVQIGSYGAPFTRADPLGLRVAVAGTSQVEFLDTAPRCRCPQLCRRTGNRGCLGAIAWFPASGPWLPARWEGVQLVPGEQLNRDRWRRYWDKTSVSYDRQMGFYDRVLFGDSRPWVCAQATGNTLEVAVGTGLNLPFYPAAVELTGIDFSPAMLGIAQARARQLGRAVDLQEADA